MNAGVMAQYIEFVADRMLGSLGYDKVGPRQTCPSFTTGAGFDNNGYIVRTISSSVFPPHFDTCYNNRGALAFLMTDETPQPSRCNHCIVSTMASINHCTATIVSINHCSFVNHCPVSYTHLTLPTKA